MYFVGTFHRNYFAYITELFQMQLFVSLVFSYTIILFSFVLLSAIIPLFSIYHENTCLVCHSFCQNDQFTTMEHATKFTLCHKIPFFCGIKCVYKASLIICLHKYVNNLIYIFEPKLTKSRPMLSLKTGKKVTVVTFLFETFHFLLTSS